MPDITITFSGPNLGTVTYSPPIGHLALGTAVTVSATENCTVSFRDADATKPVFKKKTQTITGNAPAVAIPLTRPRIRGNVCAMTPALRGQKPFLEDYTITVGNADLEGGGEPPKKKAAKKR